MPRHAASCPVGIGVSCSADRNIKAKITEEGIFLEELEHNPARFLPADAPIMKPAVEIDLDEGMDKVLETLSKYPIKTRLNLKGTLIVARDIAHARIKQMLDEGKPMPEYMKNIPFIMQDRPRRRKGWRRAVSGRRPRDGWTLTWICSRVRAGRWSWWPRQPFAGGYRRMSETWRFLPRLHWRTCRHSGQGEHQERGGGRFSGTRHGSGTQDICRELSGIHHRG